MEYYAYAFPLPYHATVQIRALLPHLHDGLRDHTES
ncbi:MAG: hypothetical protein Q619_VDC00600G0137 [Veillonella dispar DORA_11]|uniref:Uncharacterized protein n=1 Tax=Veillonella dispar DORA_11 TaxID=1403949 RepID=W1UTN9_9FIRM|nr:MAG: hypothetical protein Q619_VDC00600G0137 [Veillonella dispar DORA_11]